jgi:hypothetical protein
LEEINMNYTKLLSLLNAYPTTVDFSIPSNTLELGGGLQFDGSTSGNVLLTASSSTTSYTLVWPPAQAGGVGYVLANNGSGVLSWEPTSSLLTFADSLVNTGGTVTLVNDSASPGASQYYGTNGSSVLGYYSLPTGSVTSVSVVSANGFAGTVATATSTPAITLSTTITGILQGNGTAISAATTTGSGSVVLATSPTLVTPVLGTPTSLVLTNATGLPLTTGVTGTLPIANGGTGQTSANAAFDALSPMTTAGDLIYENSTPTAARLGIGTTGQVLTVVGGLPAWANSAVTPGEITLTDNHILVGNASNVATDVAMSGDATIVASGALTLNTVNSNIGTFASVTVNGKGLVTAAANLSGDATTSGSVLTLDTVNSNIGTFASVTVNGKGLVTAAANLSGDATTSGSVLTLDTVNSNIGTFGSSTSIPTFTVNAKGLITAASGNAVIAPAGTLTGTTLASNVVTSSLTTVGIIGAGTWQGTTVAVGYGGTGTGTAPTQYGVIYASSASAYASTAAGTANYPLVANSGAAPTFQILGIGGGGTGQTSANAAFDALSPMTTAGDLIYENSTPTAARLGIGTTGQVLTVVGGLPAWASPATSGTVTSVSVVSANGFAGTVATATSTPAITISTTINSPVLAGNGTAISAATTTGTGSTVVLATSPTLVTPALGTPSSAVLTNATGLPLTTGVTGTLPIANGGTNNSSAYTTGSVIFSNGTALTQDNANFFWNDTNYSLGIGTAIPNASAFIEGVNTTGAAKRILLSGYGTGSTIGTRGRFARGSLATPAAAQSGDILNFWSAQGYGSSSFPASSTGAINAVANETFTNASNATYLQFMVTPTGSVTLAEAMRINSTGNILMDTVTDNGTDTLQVGSGASMSYMKLNGSTSGNIQQQASATTTTYTVTWPAAQGAAGTVLGNNGSGTLSWGTSIGNSGGTSVVNINGSVTGTTRTASSNFTVDTTTTDYIIFANTSSAAFTITLPAPTNGRILYIKDSTGSFNTNNLTVAQHASENIEGLAASKLLTTAWGSYCFTSDGTSWFIL